MTERLGSGDVLALGAKVKVVEFCDVLDFYSGGGGDVFGRQVAGPSASGKGEGCLCGGLVVHPVLVVCKQGGGGVWG